MLIRCWGARGSVPVSGPEYLRFGGDTTCIEVRTKDDDIVIIDAGSGARRLGNRLVAEGRSDFTMLFTHSHWDHIMGFPFFKPVYQPSTRIALFGCPFVQDSVKALISPIMTPPNFPVHFDDITAQVRYRETCADAFTIGGMRVIPIPLNHPNQGLGYRFEEEGKSFVFLTDNELDYRHPGGMAYGDYRAFAQGADLLIHDAEYRPEEYRLTRSWGHSLYTDALNLACEAEVARLGLFHHNQDRTDRDLEAMVEECRDITAGRELACFALAQDMEVVL